MQLPPHSTVEYFDAKAFRVGIVAARFNQQVTDQMLAQALDELAAFRVPQASIEVVRVLGSVEIPLALQLLAERGGFNCLVALGCVIQGETRHFDYVCRIAADGIREVMLKFSVPIGFGLLTIQDLAQAQERVGHARLAVRAALELAALNRGTTDDQ